MSPNGPLCPGCNHLVAEGQHFCPNCGLSLDARATTHTAAIPTQDAWDPVYVQDELTARASVPRARRRANTGMLLMIVAFALLWIPYVQDLGGLLAFIGIIYLWFGRKAFDEPFRQWVVRGSLLVVIGLAVEVYVGILYASQVVGAASNPGETVSGFGAAIQSDLSVLLVGSLLSMFLVSLGYVALPYARADPTSRLLLWGAFAMAMTVSTVALAVLYPQISAAVTSATSGSTINLAPVTALDTESLEFGLLQIVPDLIFLYAYYRTRSQMLPTISPEAPPKASSKFGRTD